MNAKKKQLITMSLLAGLLIFGMLFIFGCKKSEPTPTETSMGTMQGHERVVMAEDAAEEVVAAAEQTTCPVMGGAINKALFTEYEGKKVYFCCDGCKEKFEEAPEQYIAKLPQFNQ